MLYPELSNSLIGAFYEVYMELGPGLPEAPYHNALFMNLQKKGFDVQYQLPLPVFYKGEKVGEYFADLLLENQIIVEIKSVECFCKSHIAQTLNYLRLSKCRIGFLVNFKHHRMQFKRLVL